ncbi:MAG: universal stress protein [Thermoanaerobaculia bacterium]
MHGLRGPHVRSRRQGTGGGESPLSCREAARCARSPSGIAVNAACCLAKQFDAQLHVVHVVAEKSHADLEGLQQAIREWIAPSAEEHCDFRQIVRRSGSAADQILECSNDIGADLVVVGGGRRAHGIQRGSGTTVERLIRAATIPIMSVVRPWTGALADPLAV